VTYFVRVLFGVCVFFLEITIANFLLIFFAKIVGVVFFHLGEFSAVVRSYLLLFMYRSDYARSRPNLLCDLLLFYIFFC